MTVIFRESYSVMAFNTQEKKKDQSFSVEQLHNLAHEEHHQFLSYFSVLPCLGSLIPIGDISRR